VEGSAGREVAVQGGGHDGGGEERERERDVGAG